MSGREIERGEGRDGDRDGGKAGREGEIGEGTEVKADKGI